MLLSYLHFITFHLCVCYIQRQRIKTRKRQRTIIDGFWIILTNFTNNDFMSHLIISL